MTDVEEGEEEKMKGGRGKRKEEKRGQNRTQWLGSETAHQIQSLKLVPQLSENVLDLLEAT